MPAVVINLFFVLTIRPQAASPADAERADDDYMQQGESEQRMDELKPGVKLDPFSCHRFKANFFRLILYTAAMNLLNALRDHPSLPPVLRHGQPCTWRSVVIKIAATTPAHITFPYAAADVSRCSRRRAVPGVSRCSVTA
jgi:hypothetical protein